MELGHPVIIVSAFGRGHWMATALAQEGIKATLVDVSAHLGVWPVEDVEGPFGFFRTEKTSESQMERLYTEDAFEEVSNGFTLWLSEGPFECKGPTTKFKIDQSLLAPQVKEFIGSSDNSHRISKLPFDKNWLLQLSHQFASTTYLPNAKASSYGSSLPLFSSFFVRQATRNGLEKSFEWLRSKGVEVIRPQHIEDMSFGKSRSISGLEFMGDKQGLVNVEQLVWMLSSEETYFLNERLGKYLYPEGALEPEWSWVRYRVSLQECFERNHLPKHCLMIEDIYSPWTHENMMVLQRTSSPEQFDMWMRIPSVQRFNKEYLSLRGEHMMRYLLQRMSLSEPQILSYPQEYYYTYAQLGASRFPIYSADQSGSRGKVRYSNLHLDGPEEWTQYSWSSYFEKNKNTLSKLTAWWKEKLLREQKEKRKEQVS